MRYFAWFFGILATLIVVVYVVAFTSLGNGLIKPILESKIKEQTKLESKLSKFSLSMSDFEIVLEINENNKAEIKGSYSLFSQSFDLSYDISLKNLKTLKSFSGTELRGEFYTNGNVKGDIAFMKIDGKSSVANSDTSYHVELRELNPTSIIANIKGAKLAALLYMGVQNPYATADIDMDVNFRDITPHKMDGEVVLKTKNGKIDPKYMLSDFNVSIPQTLFSMNLDAKLKGNDVDYKYELLSNLFKINSAGLIVPEPLKADLKYSLNIEDLEVLKPITKADIRGAFKLNGSVKGDKERLLVSGVSDLASSDMVFEAVLKEFALASIKAKVVNLDVAKLLYMLKQPHYSDGLFSMNADISDAKVENLSGSVVMAISKGVLDSKYLSKTYEFASPMPKTIFDFTTTTMLKSAIAETKVDFNSNIASLNIKNAKFNIEDGSLGSDYKIVIPNLDALFFVTQQHMQGGITANGELSRAKDLDFTLQTEVAEGKINAKLHNDDFFATVDAIKTNKILQILLYPEIADASLDAKIDYNLAQSRGAFEGKVTDAKFVKNQTFDLISQFIKFDIYKELFSGNVNAKIDKENILASIDLHSKDAAIKTEKTKLNTKTNQIDTDVSIRIKKDEVSGSITGDINAPKVSINMEKFMKSKAGEEVKKKIDKEVEKGLNKLFKKLF
ncbi:hypothetical protein [Sulfurimonas sp.]|jgi:hypothetical protein|uniref:hypothetical protein n=1 Tax=Sulfurimonas sp. TaxID=2022749 RepID=UPI0025D10C16|nr:hypothetical protein [Sulfurimonas sp.]MCK9472409.1 hypothetical protein [Sulfurimonas sp.]MDD3505339.1 hypothetical protein [Sulfurimonas sp.]